MVADFLQDPQAHPLPDPPIQGATMADPKPSNDPHDDPDGLWKSDYIDSPSPAPAPAPTPPSEDSE